MYLHRDNPELFRDMILLASQNLALNEDIVEKDYYVTLILQKLSESEYPVVFKGGTSLSKAYGVIDRFSEDIDITFTEYLGEARRKKLKYHILKPIADELGLVIRNWEQIESDKDYNHYDFSYDSVVGDMGSNAIPTFVKLETALMSYSFPTEELAIGNYLHTALKTEESVLKQYGLTPFTMRVQSLNRTMIDKIFALCDYYLLGKARKNARHLYDIYKLSSRVPVDGNFLILVNEVREQRCRMGVEIAPAAAPDVDIISTAERLCTEDFYKNDYQDTTIRLISDSLEYDDLKEFYLELVRKIF